MDGCIGVETNCWSATVKVKSAKNPFEITNTTLGYANIHICGKTFSLFFFFFFLLLLLIFAKWQIKVCRLVFVLFFTRNRNLTLSPVNPIYIISFRGLRVKSLCCHVLGTVSGGHFTRFPEGYDPVFQQLYCFNGVRVAFA